MSRTLAPRSDNPRTPVIIIGAIAGGLIFLAMAGSLLYLFSRKERARRRNAQDSPVHPPAYKEELSSPRSVQPRPLSSFAPDYSRQASQLSRNEQPPPYPTLPMYDPSQYQPIRPTSMVGDSRTYYQPGPSSRLSAVHYDHRLSTYHSMSLTGSPHVNANTREAREETREREPEHQGRERSRSEPLLGPKPKPPKPVLSRLITNFR
ncbi:unnamed protein product [Penicillium olsonii]|nr:unnamed protein product [Penicillium olsonii]CAG7930299.1 unnamed protein product [Penicillium olsonii]CAG8227983.1 unnamed protein product [Penicillium olsonii]